MHFRTSRSPSSKSSRKRRHSSNSASSISSISSSIGEKEKEDRLQKANAELDALVEEFLNEEKKLVDKFDVDKKHYLDFPDKHREYTSEWNYFYKKRYVHTTYYFCIFLSSHIIVVLYCLYSDDIHFQINQISG